MLKMLEFVSSLIELFVKSLTGLVTSFLNGVQFFFSTLSNIPLFIVDIFQELPSFFQVGLSGILGLLLFVVFMKLYALVKL